MLSSQDDCNKWIDAPGNRNIVFFFFFKVINTFLEKKTFSISLNQSEQTIRPGNKRDLQETQLRPTATQGRKNSEFLHSAQQDRIHQPEAALG